MKFFGKTLIDYFAALWKYFATIFIIMAIVVFIRLSSDFPSALQTLLSLVGVVFLGLGGWSAVWNHRFNLKQVVIVGILLSFGIHWTLPIFHSAVEVMYLLLVNTLIYSVIVFCGACLATIFKKRSLKFI